MLLPRCFFRSFICLHLGVAMIVLTGLGDFFVKLFLLHALEYFLGGVKFILAKREDLILCISM